MPGYSVTAANQALDALSGGTVNVLAFVNLNTADPGTTGASEATSARQACTWNAAAARAKTNSSALTFTGQAAATPHTHFSTWSAVTAGTFGISGALGSSVTAATITVAAGALSLGA
jgi:predicted ribonuclease toxin of YeeF-YezG toxin-antitoxin module